MSKKVCALLCALGIVFSLSACGKVSGATRSIEQSSLYSRHEIEKAMDVVVRHFRSDYDDCTLLELTYDEQWNLDHAEAEAQQRNADHAIIIRGSFQTGDTNNAFNPNFTYTNYNWILTTDGFGWQLSDGGYA